MYMNIHIHKHVLIKKILAQSIWEIVNTRDNQTRSLEDESPVMETFQTTKHSAYLQAMVICRPWSCLKQGKGEGLGCVWEANKGSSWMDERLQIP